MVRFSALPPSTSVVVVNEWDEGKHPRADDGKWTDGGGSGATWQDNAPEVTKAGKGTIRLTDSDGTILGAVQHTGGPNQPWFATDNQGDPISKHKTAREAKAAVEKYAKKLKANSSLVMVVDKYNPDQPRDKNGRWTSAGGSSGGPGKKVTASTPRSPAARSEATHRWTTSLAKSLRYDRGRWDAAVAKLKAEASPEEIVRVAHEFFGDPNSNDKMSVTNALKHIQKRRDVLEEGRRAAASIRRPKFSKQDWDNLDRARAKALDRAGKP